MSIVNVFGNPVTDETVRQVNPGLNRPITARDRAQVALEQNEDNRLFEVLRFTYDIKIEGYGDGTATRGMIYNATGGDLTLVLDHTWEGHMWRYPHPRLIKNGQWAAFLHVTDRATAHSKEAVVYRGTNADGHSRDWMLAWNVNPDPSNDNNVYTEIRESNAGFEWANWYAIDAAMEKQGHSQYSASLGSASGVWIETGSTSVFAGLVSLDGFLDLQFKDIATRLSTVSQSIATA